MSLANRILARNVFTHFRDLFCTHFKIIWSGALRTQSRLKRPFLRIEMKVVSRDLSIGSSATRNPFLIAKLATENHGAAY